MTLAAGLARAAPARGGAGQLPPRRAGAPPGVAGGAGPGRARRRRLGGAPWFPLYARLLGAEIGRRADLHTLPPVTGHADARQGRRGRARGRPRRVLDRRRRAPRRRGPDRRAGPRRCPQHAAARRPAWARRPRSRPGSLVVGVVPAGRVLVRLARRARRRPSPRPLAGRRRRAPALAGRLRPVVDRSSAAARGSPCSPARGAGPGRARRRTASATRCAAPCRGCPLAALVGYAVLALLVLLLVRLLALGHDRRGPPRPAGPAWHLGDAPRPGRGADLAVPALLQRPDPVLAAAARAPGSARAWRPPRCC